MATDIRSCRNMERSRRSRRLRAAPAAMSTRLFDIMNPSLRGHAEKRNARVETWVVVVVVVVVVLESASCVCPAECVSLLIVSCCDWAVWRSIPGHEQKGQRVVVVVVMSALCVCISTSHAHATESKANYYPLHAKPGDVGQCNPRNLPNPNPVIQRRPITTMMTLMHTMRSQIEHQRASETLSLFQTLERD